VSAASRIISGLLCCCWGVWDNPPPYFLLPVFRLWLWGLNWASGPWVEVMDVESLLQDCQQHIDGQREECTRPIVWYYDNAEW